MYTEVLTCILDAFRSDKSCSILMCSNISCERRVMVSSLEAPPTLFGAGEHCVFIDVGASCNTKLCVFVIK